MQISNLTRRAFMRGSMAALAMAPNALWAATWKLLGSRSVLLQADVDVIPVTFLQGTFTHLQLRVRGNGVYINSMVVTFTNGQTQSLPVRNFIPAGGQTRQIDLPGNRRFIRGVELRYRSQANARGRATVQLWGRK
jgi:hypothetical protein